MKKLFTHAFLALGLAIPVASAAQCSGGTNEATITPTTAWQVRNNCDAGKYLTFNATAGNTYEFSYCAANGGGASTYDTQLSICDNTGTPVGGTGYSDDFCGAQSFVSWVAPTTATYRILSNQWNCLNNPNSMGNLAYRYIAPTPPNCSNLSSPANGAINICSSGATLTWAASTGAGTPTGYELYLGTNNLPTNVINGTNVGNVLTYTTGALSPNTTYYWYVVPTNSAGDATGCSAMVRSFTTDGGCYVMPTTGTTNYSACGGTFYDAGGAANNYGNNQTSTVTFCPSTPGQYVQVSFSSFVTEATYDVLTIYNGNTTGAPVIGTYSGTNSPCLITSTAANGCLTFRFVSDGSFNYAGWVASLTCVAAPPAGFPGSVCASAIAISIPYTATGQTTTCSGNNYTNASTGSCGTLYESGEDYVYSVTVAGTTCIGITLSNCSSSNIGYQVYSGCPGNAGTTCIANNGGANPLSGTVTLPAAGTYYIIVDSYSAPFNVNYDISVVNYGSAPGNDLPCNATALALNVNLSGDNSCSGSASEPAAASCWSTGTINSVWYSVVCPASGQLRIRTTLGTLANTQIALYSGTCGSLTQVACNDNAPACGTSSYNNSEITATGLTSGATYFIRVDGVNNLTGTFDIMAVNGAVGFPAAAGQDCSSPNPVCAASIAVGNPGYQAYGNICDFPGGGTNCLLSGERGSVWYTIPINAAGTLTFDIVPNDWPGAPSTICTDYDFALWKTAGSGATNCAGIAGGATPLRCNYSGLGVTGLYTTTGTAPPAYPGFGGAYEANLTVASGDVYVLVISNFSNSTSGFTINFGGTAPINYTAAGNTVSWTGGTNTNWTLATNWGGCTPPICGINAVVGPSSSNQPILTAGNYYVNDLTINPGGVLTLQAGANLHICGNFTNSGSIVANAASTVTFDNAAANHTLTGAFVGADALGNLVVNQTGGTVTMNNNLDLKGSFTTSSATSVFNINGLYLKVAGNFTNNSLGTFINPTNSTVEFNGTGPQTYNHGSGANLYNVVMNHTGSGVTLATNMAITNSLTLTLGRIITGANLVAVNNGATTACTAGNTSSFVEGNLRRFLSGAAGAYDFPVGSPTTGYQRANINFTTTTTIPMLTARFDNYAPPMGPTANECPNNTYSALPMFNNGYWTISASANGNNGTYTTTLYPTNVSNNTGLGWTVAKGNTTATYALNGTCAASTASQVIRTGMNGFSVFGVAQSTAPLPVEFISFTGVALEEKNQLSWTTATETNNQFFYIERSDDGVNFSTIGRKDGAGTSSMVHHYAFDDFSPIEGTNYYRLRQVDYNGAAMYSDVISLEFHRGNMTVTNVKPNPTNGEVNFDFNSPIETKVHIVITDVTGRVVKDELVTVKPGTTQVYTAIEESGAGVYTMIVTEERYAFRSVTRLVKY